MSNFTKNNKLKLKKIDICYKTQYSFQILISQFVDPYDSSQSIICSISRAKYQTNALINFLRYMSVKLGYPDFTSILLNYSRGDDVGQDFYSFLIWLFDANIHLIKMDMNFYQFIAFLYVMNYIPEKSFTYLDLIGEKQEISENYPMYKSIYILVKEFEKPNIKEAEYILTHLCKKANLFLEMLMKLRKI